MIVLMVMVIITAVFWVVTKCQGPHQALSVLITSCQSHKKVLLGSHATEGETEAWGGQATQGLRAFRCSVGKQG